MWTYQGREFTSEDIGDHIGFVYLITHKKSGKKYIGKKVFVSRTKRPPLKGQKRKRVVLKESNWKEYFGSSDEVKSIVEQEGEEAFHREILHLCKSKGIMSYLELKEQVERKVLLRSDYFNGIIQCKIHRTHVKSLNENNSQ